MVQDLSGRWVLVTGAASGIGRETALAFAREGCDLVAVDVDEAGLLSLESELKSFGADTLCRVVDISDGGENSLVEVRRKSDIMPDLQRICASWGFSGTC